MITYYFDTNLRTLIQSPGNQAPASPQTWVYGDNYNLQVYVVQAGVFLPILASDTLTAMLYQPQPSLPEQQLAIIGTPQHLTDVNGNNYFSLNVNLATTQLAAITQATNKPAVCEFHFVFNPADQERFSESQDVQTTVNPDPTQGASGGTPVPPGYPANPNVFEQVANKGVAGGYVGLDANSHLNPSRIPTDTTLQVSAGLLSVVGGTGGGNPYVGVIPATFTIPAEGANVSVTLSAPVPDILAGASLSITDGVSFINVLVATITGTALTVTNNGPPGAVTGTMGVNSHVYMGSTAGPTDTARRGTAQKLPTANPTTTFYRGDDSFAAVAYTGLSNVPSAFSPIAHATQHIPGGNDVIPLVTTIAEGLCPPIDNSTIIISGGKLTATVSGGGGNAWVATIPGSFAVPAAQATVAITLAAAAADLSIGMSIAIADAGAHIINGIVTAVSGTSLTFKNIGTGSVSGTMGAGSHVYIGNTSDISSGQGGSGTFGAVRADGTTITNSSGTLSAATGGIGQHGARIASVNSTQTVPANALTTINIFAGKSWDTDNYASGAGPWAGLVIPTAQMGFYQVEACLVIANADTTGTYRAIQLLLGGTMVAESSIPPQASIQNRQYIRISDVLWISSSAPAGASGAGTWPTSLTLAVALLHDSSISGGLIVGFSGAGFSGCYLSALRIS